MDRLLCMFLFAGMIAAPTFALPAQPAEAQPSNPTVGKAAPGIDPFILLGQSPSKVRSQVGKPSRTEKNRGLVTDEFDRCKKCGDKRFAKMSVDYDGGVADSVVFYYSGTFSPKEVVSIFNPTGKLTFVPNRQNPGDRVWYINQGSRVIAVSHIEIGEERFISFVWKNRP